MTYKAGDQVRDEFNVPIHKLIFQKIKKTCESWETRLDYIG